ncbi:MAG: hypothetical protein UX59_C0015G0007 [Microgenomates group bacterium GW2011_GWA1_46_7]|nr:MAG: hypothetical protein UX59_C0015G0007 [Microgenomates group bacterium GW2011_GWA1_46_7]
MGNKGGRKSGNDELTLTKNLGFVESGVDHGTGRTISKGASVEEEGNV